MLELAGNLPRGALLGDPTVVSEVVRPYQPDRGHGLTSCAPNHAPHPRVELSLTRTAAHPYQMSESEMGLTLPDSSLLTRGAGRPYPTQRLEMSPPDKGRFRTLQCQQCTTARVHSEFVRKYIASTRHERTTSAVLLSAMLEQDSVPALCSQETGAARPTSTGTQCRAQSVAG